SSPDARSLNAAEAAAARALLDRPAAPPPASAAAPRSILVPDAAAAPAAGDFELGSVVWRAAIPEVELRSWARAPLAPPGGAADLRPTRAIALPFYPASAGDLLVFQDYKRAIALRLPGLTEAWTHPLGGRTGEEVNALRVPAPGREVVT